MAAKAASARSIRADCYLTTERIRNLRRLSGDAVEVLQEATQPLFALDLGEVAEW